MRFLRLAPQSMRDDLQHLKANLGEAHGNLAKARKLLLAETIDATDFKAMKAEYEKEILAWR